MKAIPRYPLFLLFSYTTALFFETLANTVGDGKLFSQQGWPVFFVLWYGLLYSVLYMFFSRRRLLWIGIAGAVIGPLLEIVVFKRFHPIDAVIYALMFILPFMLQRRFSRKK